MIWWTMKISELHEYLQNYIETYGDGDVSVTTNGKHEEFRFVYAAYIQKSKNGVVIGPISGEYRPDCTDYGWKFTGVA